jgi:hypothetical protein
MWRSVVALLAAPSVVLAEQTIGYALLTPACQHQAGAWLHTLPVAALLLLAGLGWLAFGELQRERGRAVLPDDEPKPADSDRPERNATFFATLALGIVALSALTVLALWLPHWLLSPCVT